MQIRFLETSEDGMRWMLRYYERVFPVGRKSGLQKYQEAKKLLLDNPFAGHQFDDLPEVRERSIVKTPFSIVYTVRDDTIYVIDIRDQRGIRTVAGTARFRK